MYDFIVTGSSRALLISYVPDQAKEFMTACKDYQQENISLWKLGRILGQTGVPTNSTYSDLFLTAGTWAKENLILKICHIQTEWCPNEILFHKDREEGSPWGGEEILTTETLDKLAALGISIDLPVLWQGEEICPLSKNEMYEKALSKNEVSSIAHHLD